MSWRKDVQLDIELPNGEVWRIDYVWAARLIAESKYSSVEEPEKHFEERGYYIHNPEEIVYDLQGAADWDDIVEHAELVAQPYDIDYQEQWVGSDVYISIDERGEE